MLVSVSTSFVDQQGHYMYTGETSWDTKTFVYKPHRKFSSAQYLTMIGYYFKFNKSRIVKYSLGFYSVVQNLFTKGANILMTLWLVLLIWHQDLKIHIKSATEYSMLFVSILTTIGFVYYVIGEFVTVVLGWVIRNAIETKVLIYWFLKSTIWPEWRRDRS